MVLNFLKNCDILYIFVDIKRFFVGVEKFKLKRCFKNGVVVDFCVELCYEFEDFANDGEGFLFKRECEYIVFLGLEYIKSYEDGIVFGYFNVKFYRNRVISKFIFFFWYL